MCAQIRRPRDAFKPILRDLQAGEPEKAYAAGLEALKEFPGDLEIAHATVLGLARARGHVAARRLFEELKLRHAVERGGSDLHSVEIAALEARLLKDEALASAPPSTELLRKAVEAYERVYRDTGDVYPGINAATLWVLAGDRQRAREIADRIVKTLGMRRFYATATDYYSYATEAEAKLILDDVAGAREALLQSATAPGADAASKSTTRRQLAALCAALGIPADILAPLDPKGT